jgi:hypothetical protein
MMVQFERREGSQPAPLALGKSHTDILHRDIGSNFDHPVGLLPLKYAAGLAKEMTNSLAQF